MTVAFGPPLGPGSIHPLLSVAVGGSVAQPASQKTAPQINPDASARHVRCAVEAIVSAADAVRERAWRGRPVAPTFAVDPSLTSLSFALASTVT
jgi:hypothetical protein